MKLLSGDSLDPKAFFTYDEGQEPTKQASSIDLTVGRIFNSEGHEVSGSFVLKPGHMVQVISAQSFNLPAYVTGHVTYKTGMTREGVWALTVGIVDPGWKGPVATTLLNFSDVNHGIDLGDEFLRVSLFEHEPVPSNLIRETPTYDAYVRGIKKLACRFPPTFLDHEGIAKSAGNTAVRQIRNQALAWVAGLGVMFAILQVIGQVVGSYVAPTQQPAAQLVNELRAEIKEANDRISELERQVAHTENLVSSSGEIPRGDQVENTTSDEAPTADDTEPNIEKHEMPSGSQVPDL